VKVGDLVKYSEDEYNDRLGTRGLVIDVQKEGIIPDLVSILWETHEFETVFADELVVTIEA